MGLGGHPYLVIVGLAGEFDPHKLRAFVASGNQGVNYHRGTWHMPLMSNEEGQRFLIIDRAPGDGNCEEVILEQAVILQV